MAETIEETRLALALMAAVLQAGDKVACAVARAGGNDISRRKMDDDEAVNAARHLLVEVTQQLPLMKG